MIARRLTPLLAAALWAGCASAEPRGFSFFAAEFQRPDRALADAQAFVAERLPAGLPLVEARRRLGAAELPCPRTSAGAGFTCRLGVPIHIGGGLIGEDTWAVHVEGDGAGRVAAAALDRYVVGTGPPNPQ